MCAGCGAELVPGARFCDACGAAVSETPEAPVAHELRKTVTVVFADLVGSTILQERLDPESVRRVMTRFYDAAREGIDAHDGRVVKFIGDGVMAAFGTPVVREDDALRAVRAAVAMLERVEELGDELERDWGVRLRVRIGVNTGEVVVDRDDGDVVGDPVNVAARLEEAAADGEVLVGEETRRLVRHDVSLEPVAPLELKGKGTPVVAYRLLSAAPAPGEEARIEAPLVGRDPELARLRAVFDAAVAERSCRLVTVVGSPGIGKTRLAHELAHAVEGEATVLEGRCEPADEGITFAPIAEVLRAAAAIDEADPPETAREKLGRLLADDADCELLVERALGVLGATRAASTEETFWAIRRVLEVLARERPLVLVLDDLQWGQPTFLDLVEHLVEWARDVPLLLVALARPELRELREALVGGRRVADVIELDALDAAESRTLVDELLGQAALPERLAERVLHTTEGNPLFVGETVRMLVDEGVLQRAGDGWVVSTESIDVEMPPTIHALIAARLERLRDDERAVVERASVIGKQFYRGAVAQLCSSPIRREIDGHLETLRRKELVEPEGTYWIDEPVFRFHHILIRDAAYRSLLKEARAELHERFADWLESKAGDLIGEHEEVVAFHLERAHEYRTQLGPLDERGRALGQRAAERLASAGRRALAREDLPAAANLLGRALDRLDESAAARPGLLADLAEALLSAGDTHGAASAVEALRAGAGGDARLRALASVYAGQLAYLTDSSRLHETVESADAAAEELASLGDEAGVAKARHVQAGAFARLGQVGACEGALDRALAAARSVGDGRRVSAVLSGAPQAALWGPSPVVRASGRCLDVVRILRMTPGNRHLEAAALSCQAVLEAMRGRAQQARAMLDGCRATFEELGLGVELLETEVHAGIVELLGGDAAAAEGPLRSAYEGFAALGAGGATERAAALLARTLLEQGRDDEADELSRISEERGGEDLKATIAWCGVRAEVLARRDEHDAAEELARRGVAMAGATDALTDHADARMALAAVVREAGRDAEAAEEAWRALELYEAKENEAGGRRAKEFTGVAAPTARAAAAPAAAPKAAPSVTWAHLADAFTAAMDARDADAFAELVTDDVLFLNHRRAATWQEARGAQGWLELQKAFWEASPDVRYSIEFVDGDELVATVIGRLNGHLAEGGGEWSLAFLAVWRLHGDRVDHTEIFDEGEEAAARACAERLRAEVAGESANRALARRWNDSLRARDWDAWRACHAPGLMVVDHRAGTPLDPERDLETYEAQCRALVDQASDAWLEYEIIVDVDEVGAIRGAWRGHLNDGGGEFETPLVVVTRRDGDHYDIFDIFDPDDDAAWCARSAELLGERGEGSVVYARWLAAYHARDWDAYRSIWADDLTVIDHRQVGVGEIRGFDAFMDFSRGLVELAPDLRAHVVRVLDVTPTLGLVRQDFRGHAADGGEIEVPYLILGRIRDGLGDLLELFDPAEEAAARRRFAELAGTVEQSPNERLIRRWADAVRARDWDRAADCLIDDFVTVDRRSVSTTAERDKTTFIAQTRALVDETSDAWFEYETVADIDEVSSTRCRWFGHLKDGGGEVELPFVVVGRRAGDRLERLEIFDADDDAAFGGRFAELLGERGAALAVGARLTDIYNARDWDAMRAIHTKDAVWLDHRQIGAHDLHGPGSIVDFLEPLIELTPDLRGHPVRVLDATPRLWLASIDFRGHTADGGEVEMPYLSLGVVRDGQVERIDLFDSADEEAARQRFEELGREPEPSPNERLIRRYMDAVNAREWDAADACLARDAVRIDHRVASPAGGESDRETFVAQVRSLVDQARDARLEYEIAADIDELASARCRWYGHLNDGGGAFEIPFLVIGRRCGDHLDRIEIFDADDDGPSSVRFAELLGDRGAALAVGARWVDCHNRRDWDGLRACYSEDAVLVDHRQVGFGEVQGAQGIAEFVRTLVDLAPDLHCSVGTIDTTPELWIVKADFHGHSADGGEVELPYLAVSRVRGGLCELTELYDPADEADARRRYEELAAGPEPSLNESLARRFTDAFNRRDWDAAGECWTDDFVTIDRRPAPPLGAGERDWPTWRAQLRALVETSADVRGSFEIVADFDNVIAARYRWSGHWNEGGGEFEIPYVGVGHRRGDRFDRTETFAPDDDAVWCGRFAELLGPRGAAAAVGARATTCYHARDWEGFRANYADATVQVDHRRVGGGELHGSQAVVDWVRGLVDVAPDMRLNVVRVLDVAPNLYLGRHDTRGHAAEGGGAVEVPYLTLIRVTGDVIDRTELFDPTDEAAARRRFQELSRRAPGSTRELLDRFAAAYNAQDWEALGALYTQDFRFEDRRPLGWGSLTGIGPVIERVRGAFDLAPDLRMTVEPLALGGRALVYRVLSRGHLAAGGGELEIEIIIFGLFEEIGAQTESERLHARVCRSFNARDWETLGDCHTEDFELIDRRALAWDEIHGRETVVDLYRSWVAVAPDMELWFEVLDSDDEHIALHWVGHGHATAGAGGGPLEYPSIVLATLRNGQSAHVELFDSGDGEAALARLDELRRQTTRAR